jgi:hypothetical protein
MNSFLILMTNPWVIGFYIVLAGFLYNQFKITIPVTFAGLLSHFLIAGGLYGFRFISDPISWMILPFFGFPLLIIMFLVLISSGSAISGVLTKLVDFLNGTDLERNDIQEWDYEWEKRRQRIREQAINHLDPNYQPLTPEPAPLWTFRKTTSEIAWDKLKIMVEEAKDSNNEHA